MLVDIEPIRTESNSLISESLSSILLFIAVSTIFSSMLRMGPSFLTIVSFTPILSRFSAVLNLKSRLVPILMPELPIGEHVSSRSTYGQLHVPSKDLVKLRSKRGLTVS